MPTPQYGIQTRVARALSYAVAAVSTGLLAIVLALLIFYVPLWLTEGNGNILQLWPWIALPVGLLVAVAVFILVTPRLGLALAEIVTPPSLRRITVNAVSAQRLSKAKAIAGAVAAVRTGLPISQVCPVCNCRLVRLPSLGNVNVEHNLVRLECPCKACSGVFQFERDV